MSFWSKLFGAKPANPVEQDCVEYKDFRITPDAIRDGASFRIAAMIEKTVDGEVKSHHLIRADTLGSKDAADAASVMKAKTMIDQMGDGVFR